MHSKWQIWDFLKNHEEVINPHSKGLYSFWSFDPFINRILKERIPEQLGGENPRVLLGNDLSPEWIENNLQTLSLFGGGEPYIVQHAELIPNSVSEMILEGQVDFSDRFFILFFYKDCPLRQKLNKKKDEAIHTSIMAPAFWEFSKLLDFLADYFHIRFSFEGKKFFLDTIPHECAAFYNALNVLKLIYPDHQELSQKDIEDVLVSTRLDKFQLAQLFCQRKFNGFFAKLLSIELDYDQLRSFFSFMQGHLIKVMDPSYVERKPRVSKYDREIVGQSKMWRKKDLLKSIRTFAELEILVKRKDPSLLPRLRQYYLSSFS